MSLSVLKHSVSVNVEKEGTELRFNQTVCPTADQMLAGMQFIVCWLKEDEEAAI